MDKVKDWVDKNPLLTGGIVFGVGLIILWWLGYFSSSSSSSNTSATNLASAYYAAEAASATAGTQLQMATVAATNQTAQVQAQANAAEAIAATQANAQTAIAGYGSGVAINNANDALQTSNLAGDYAYMTSTAHDNAMNFNSFINTILPQELALSGGGAVFTIPGGGMGTVNAQGPNPNMLTGQGYTPAQLAQMFG